MTAHATMQQLVTIKVAANQMGIHPQTLRGMLRAGAPVVRRGRRGRGGQALVDVHAIEAWQASRNGAGDAAAVLEALAARMPEVVAGAIWSVFLLCHEKPLDRRTLPGALAAGWYAIAKALRDQIAIEAPNIPDITSTPQQIEQLIRHLDRNR